MGIKQKKRIIHCWASGWLLLFFFSQSSQPSMNFNISELVYYVDRRRSCSHGNILFDLQCIKRLLTHPVFSVDVCTMFQQKFNNRLLSVPTGKMKRGQKKLPKIGKTNAVKYRWKRTASSVYNDGLRLKLRGCYWTNFYDQAKNKAKTSLLYPL